MNAPTKILIRATNWVGDCIMSLPAVRALREAMPGAHVTIHAKPGVADIYRRETAVNQVIEQLSNEPFDIAILFPNSFASALTVWRARIPRRIGYNRDARRLLLTDPIPPPQPGEIPRHERFYYLELLIRAGIISSSISGAGPWPAAGSQPAKSRHSQILAISPGAQNSKAKQYPPQSFAEAAIEIAKARGAEVVLYGSPGERELCDQIAKQIQTAGIPTRSEAGQTTLAQFMDQAATCRLFLTNDSGAMHIADALGIPTVTIFGPTDETTTGPTGPHARVIRELVECAPCLLRTCPIDHRCMTRVTPERVAAEALNLWEETQPA